MRRRWTRWHRCRRTLAELQTYLDGEADPGAASLVARHLSDCEDCYGDAEVIRSVKEAVARLRVAPDPATMVRLRQLVAALRDGAGS